MVDPNAALNAELAQFARDTAERAKRRIEAGAALDALTPDEIEAVLNAPKPQQPKARKPVYTADGQRLGRVALWK